MPIQVVVEGVELFDEETNKFIPPAKDEILQLEHSLVSLSKWESKWQKPFLGKEQKTIEETIDYIRCMTITQNVNPDVYLRMSDSVVSKITNYINSSQTATTIKELSNTKKNRDIITSEIIYYWMTSHRIPWEAQRWHLNRLITLIRVCNIKNDTKPKKMNRKEMLTNRSALNAQRRAAYNSKG